MSPVIVVRKGKPLVTGADRSGKAGERLTLRDWMGVGVAVVCTGLLLMGLQWLSAGKPASAQLPPVAAVAPAQVLQAAPEPPAPPAPTRTMMLDDAVRATTRSLRQHSLESPDAPDALSEERIKALEQQRALLL